MAEKCQRSIDLALTGLRGSPSFSQQFGAIRRCLIRDGRPYASNRANVGRLRESNCDRSNSEAEDAIGVFVKDILTVVAFVMVPMCFAMFLITVKPDLLSAVPTRVEPAHCKMEVSREPVCRSESECRER
jgi:hypothetical protein